MTLVGLPHSEIPGSKRACRSPRHIAACHVFHRLSVPRHPPSTLSNLTIKCLDLMRSAVPHRSEKRVLCISIYLPIFNCQRRLRSRRPTLSSIVSGSLLTARTRGHCFRRCGNWSNQKGLDDISAQPWGGSRSTSGRKMVELIGIEPTTLCLQSRCSPS